MAKRGMRYVASIVALCAATVVMRLCDVIYLEVLVDRASEEPSSRMTQNGHQCLQGAQRKLGKERPPPGRPQKA